MRCPVVLSVEDDDGSYAVLRELLQQAHPDVRVERARNGSEALKKLNGLAQDPNADVRLVLLDVRLPGMSGFEVLAAIRDNESLRRVPIVVLTGKAEEALGWLVSRRARKTTWRSRGTCKAWKMS